MYSLEVDFFVPRGEKKKKESLFYCNGEVKLWFLKCETVCMLLWIASDFDIVVIEYYLNLL